MDQEEKLNGAIQALRLIANASTTQPATTAESFDGDYYSWSGGNYDDAAEIGRIQGAWYAAEEARSALRLLGEKYDPVTYHKDDE